MRKLLLIFAAIGMMAGFAGKVMGQGVDIPTAGEDITWSLSEMKLVGVVGTPPSLTFIQPTVAGDSILSATAATSYLQYTSVVTGAKLRKINVAISGTVPTSTKLYVVAGADAGSGNGTVGTASDVRGLVGSATALDIVTGIGSCFTNTGSTDGRLLTYTWSVIPTGWAALKTTSGSSIHATYTITDSQ